MKIDDLSDMKILIVDDDESNVALLEEILEDGGYRDLRGLKDPRLVAPITAEYQPDLILLDMMMPFLDGVEVMERLKSDIPIDAYLPILMLTADTTPSARQHALRAGARDFVTKPFDADEVLLRVNNLLETRALYVRQQRHARERIHALSGLLDQAQDAIVVCDLDGHIRFWSMGAERVYGWAEAEAVGKDVRELLGDANSATEPQAYRMTVETGAWDGVLDQTTKEGKYITVASRWTLACDSPGGTKSLVIISSDVTEKKALEERFLRTQRLESVGTLAGGIAHDLNNTLTPILIGVQLLGMRFTDPHSREMLAGLESVVQRAAGMVKQILNFARGTEGRREPVHLSVVVPEIAQMVRHTFPKNIDVQVSLPADLWPVSGEATQIYQILMNLFVNSRDAMPRGGRLSIAAENLDMDGGHHGIRPGRHVALKVSDTGHGISEEIRDRVFEPFFTTKEHGKGTGLGLATVLGIVKGYGGALDFTSDVGTGTKFVVYLPAVDPPVDRQIAVGCTFPEGEGARILVVDDELIIREMTSELLQAHGYRVLTAADGAEAVALYSRHRQDITAVVTDMNMPLMDGAATIRALRELDPDVRIIATSGLSAGLNEAERQGATFLPKPYTAYLLLTTLRDVLRPVLPVV